MHSIYGWIFFIFLILSLLAIDLGFFHKAGRRLTFSAAIGLSIFYVSLALLFNLGIYFTMGKNSACDFLAGYLIEKSLSVDNLFVFVLVFKHFSVEGDSQHRVLFFGILGALVFRMLLICAGISLFSTVKIAFLFFGVLLVFTGIKMLWVAVSKKEEHSEKTYHLIRWLSRHLPIDQKADPTHFVIKKRGKWCMTPLFLVLMLIEISDVLFAMDSIPAIFAITQDPFIVYTSNIFAILGLRALYFALHHTIERFIFVKHAISLVLIFVGTKLLINTLFKHDIVTTEHTLLFIVVVMSVALFMSGKRITKRSKN
jgi:tellurite resistance protein TerC